MDSDDFLSNDEKEKFDWGAYLQEINSETVPLVCFPHVNKRADIILMRGMFIEISYIEDGKEKYWVATVINCLGPVVRMRYLGDHDSNNDIWKMVTSFKAHPIGWYKRAKKALTPPNYLLANNIKVNELLKGLENKFTVNGNTFFEFEQFAPGMKLEIEDEENPYTAWIVNILENYGGRIQLRYDTPDSAEPPFWLWYNSQRIHPYGWSRHAKPTWSMKKPSYIDEKNQNIEEWNALKYMNVSNFELECKVSHIESFQYKEPTMKHDFKEGMKLEAIDSKVQTEISPATIVEICDKYHFKIQIDHSGSKFLVTLDHPYIFPVGWAESNGLKLRTPNCFNFEWEEYLCSTNSVAAVFTKVPKSCSHITLTNGMKLESVNPKNRDQICVGSIVSVHQDLLRIKLLTGNKENDELYLIDLFDGELFPAGWCIENNHPFTPPTDFIVPLTKKKEVSNELNSVITPAPLRTFNEKTAIYINNKCFTGPFLSKSKVASLPKCIGPGPIQLVLLYVLKRVANIAYVQMRILRELAAPKKTLPGRVKEELKVKYKKRVYKGTVEVPLGFDQLEKYCLEVCEKLQVCPNLISTKVIEECPLNCSERNKTKTTKDVTKKKDKQSIDYKSFMHKPTINPIVFINRKPFQKDMEVNKENTSEEKNVWNKEKCLRKRKVNVFLEREKKRLKINDDDETGSSKGKESEENSAEDDDKRKRNKVQLDNEENARRSQRLESKYGAKKTNEIDIIAAIKDFKEKNLQLPKSNPLVWTVDDVFKFISQSKELSTLAEKLKEEAIDGQSLMLLNLTICFENLSLDIKTSILLCRFVETVRYNFFKYFQTLLES